MQLDETEETSALAILLDVGFYIFLFNKNKKSAAEEKLIKIEKSWYAKIT